MGLAGRRFRKEAKNNHLMLVIKRNTFQTKGQTRNENPSVFLLIIICTYIKIGLGCFYALGFQHLPPEF